jgi:hypothetical protein
MKKLIFLLALLPLVGFSQKETTRKIVQMTGITVSSDSLKPVPFASILIKGNYRGTLSDYSGFYSIVANTGDTLIFTSLGYKNIEYVIPDSLEDQQYSLIQIMDRDTFLLPTAVIDIWPSYEQFKQAFVNKDIPEGELARAEKNLSKDILHKQAVNLHLGAAGNHKLLNEQQKAKLYYSGQLPPNNLLNPLAWAKLIKAWQAGDFDKEEK